MQTRLKLGNLSSDSYLYYSNEIFTPLSLALTEYSHELYMCSKLDRNGYPTFDLSHDRKLNPPYHSHCHRFTICKGITKVVAGASHFQPVINSRLLAMIQSKLWQTGKALSRKNASQRKLILAGGKKAIGLLNWSQPRFDRQSLKKMLGLLTTLKRRV